VTLVGAELVSARDTDNGKDKLCHYRFGATVDAAIDRHRRFPKEVMEFAS
jgi:hypothetical protein